MNLTKFDIIIPPQDITCAPGLQEKLANGESGAFAWVYKNYCKRVFKYAMLLTGDEIMSEDIVHEVFIRLWMKRENIREIEYFNSYLNTMCRNYTLNVINGEKKEQTRSEKYFESLPDSARDVEEMMNYKETSKLIQDAVKQLPKCRRRIFEMKQQDMSIKEITQQLGKHSKTVYNQLQRAERFLKEKLGL